MSGAMACCKCSLRGPRAWNVADRFSQVALDDLGEVIKIGVQLRDQVGIGPFLRAEDA